MKRFLFIVLIATICPLLFAQGSVVGVLTITNSSEDTETSETNLKSASGDEVEMSSYEREIPPFPFTHTPTQEFKEFCPDSYSYLRQWNSCNVAGTTFLAIGLVGCAVGGGIYSGYPFVGAVLLGIGVPCTSAGITLACVGSYKKKRAREVYDECVRNRNNVYSLNEFSINLQSSSDGFGISLKF